MSIWREFNQAITHLHIIVMPVEHFRGEPIRRSAESSAWAREKLTTQAKVNYVPSDKQLQHFLPNLISPVNFIITERVNAIEFVTYHCQA